MRLQTKLKVPKGLGIERLEEALSYRVLGMGLSDLIVCALIIVYTAVFSHLTILRHFAFRTRAWDLGIFNQALWTTLNNGKLFYHTTELYLNPSGSFFGVHISPILFLVLPIYALSPSPQTLLMLQSFVLALGALPLSRIAGEHLNSRAAGMVLSTAYLLYPAIHGANWSDFHLQAFIPVFFFSALYYLGRERWVGYFAFTILALMCEEHVAFIVIFLGLYTAWRYRGSFLRTIESKKLADTRVLVPVVSILMALSWFLLTLWIRDTFFPINPDYYREFLGAPNFTILGVENPLSLPLYVFLRPHKAIEALMYNSHLKALYLLLLFGPLLFLPLRSGLLLATVPWFGFTLLSQTSFHYSVLNHYSPYVIPFIFVATVYELGRKLAQHNHDEEINTLRKYMRRLLVLSFLFFLIASPLGLLVNVFFPIYGLQQPTEHEILLSRIVGLIPSNASVLTQNVIFPHVSSRLDAYVVPYQDIWNLKPRELTAYLKTIIEKVEFVIVDTKSDPQAGSLLSSFIKTDEFGLLAYGDGIFLYKRGYRDEPLVFTSSI